MYYIGLEGNEINTRFAQDDNFMVEFQSFLTPQPSRYYWQAEPFDAPTMSANLFFSIFLFIFNKLSRAKGAFDQTCL